MKHPVNMYSPWIRPCDCGAAVECGCNGDPDINARMIKDGVDVWHYAFGIVTGTMIGNAVWYGNYVKATLERLYPEFAAVVPFWQPAYTENTDSVKARALEAGRKSYGKKLAKKAALATLVAERTKELRVELAESDTMLSVMNSGVFRSGERIAELETELTRLRGVVEGLSHEFIGGSGGRFNCNLPDPDHKTEWCVKCVLSALLSAVPAESCVACMDCGLPYIEHGLDTTLTNEQWRLIHDNEGGLLCGRCIAVRAHKLEGAVAIRARIAFAHEVSEREGKNFHSELAESAATLPDEEELADILYDKPDHNN